MQVKLVSLIVALLIAPAPASAYLDPSSGSMVFQLAVGGLLAAGAAMRLYWHKLGGLLGLGKPDEDDDPAADDEPTPPPPH